VNGTPPPPPANIPNPVELTGNFSAQPGAGMEKEYGVQIDWGDSSAYTVWRYSDSGNAYPYLTWTPNSLDIKNFTGTYNTNPGGGYADLGHNYTTGGNYTITVKFFHGQPPGAESADATTSIGVHVLVPEIRVSKSGPAYAHEGDLITYNITVSNPSTDTTMYKVSVIDSLLGDKSASFSASLAPLASDSETFTYTVPTHSGNIINTVTVTYKDIFNEQKTASASWTVTVLHPSIQVAKTGPLYAHEGDLITYNITVSNPSNGTMTRVSVIDSLLGDKSASFSASLAPLASDSETFTYTVPTHSGNISNTVTVTYKDAGNQQQTVSASWVVTVLHPGISVSKSGPNYAHEGDTITFTIIVSNTGDCQLYSVSVTDTLLGSIYSNGLAFGETKIFTVNYTVPTPSGDVSNTVTASGSDVLGGVKGTVSDTASWFVKVQYQITVTASPAGAIGGAFNVTYTKSGTTYTNVQETTTWTEWVDSGTNVTVSNPQDPFNDGLGTRYRFDHFDPSASVSMTGPRTIIASYVTQYNITFDQTGVGSDFTGTVVTIDSSDYGVSGLPVSFWWDENSVHIFSFASPLTVNPIKQYVWSSTSGLSTLQNDPLTVTTSGSVVGNYILQNAITFDQLGVSSDFTGTVVVIDGTPYGVTALPVSFYWPIGSTHNFTFQSPLIVTEDTKQYVWTSTNGLSSAQSGSITVTTYGSIVGNYKTQYYITVTSAHDSPTASAWVDEGNDFTASVTSPTETVAGDHQWVCTDHSVDGGASESGTSHTFTNVLEKYTIVFNWKEQFWIQVDSDHDSPTVSQWVDQSGSLTVSVTSPADDNGLGTRYRCTGYTLDSNSPVTDGSTNYEFKDIQSTHTIIFNWIVQYRLIVASAHDSPVPSVGDHWYDTGDHVDASVTSPADDNGLGTRYRCTGYTGTGSVSSGSGTSVGFDITAPSTLTWNWMAQYYLTVTSAHDTPSGQGWYNSGATAYATLTDGVVSGGAGTQYVFTGWSGDASGTGLTSNAITMNSPKTATAQWKTQYKLIMATNFGTTSPSVGDHWYDAGSVVSIQTFAPTAGSGERYVWNGWTGTGTISYTGTNNPASVTMNGPITETAAWTHQISPPPPSPPPPSPPPPLQYQITFNQSGIGSDFNGTIVTIDGSDYGFANLPISFWFDEGSTHSFSFVSPLAVNSGKRYVWTSTVGLSTLQNDTLTITTSGNVTGEYKTQYYLSVKTDPDGIATISGEGWYDENTYASITTDEFVNIIGGASRYSFKGWTTDDMLEIADPSTTFTTVLMDKAKTVTANYVTQYNITFDQSGVGSDFNDTVVTVDTVGYGVNYLPVSFWWDNGSTHTFSYQSPLVVTANAKQYVWTSTTGLSTLQSDTITVSTSGSITGNYVTQYYLTVKTDPEGIVTIPGEGWYDKDTNVTLTAPMYVQVGDVRYRFDCWEVDTLIIPDNPIIVYMDAPHSATARYTMQYAVTFDQSGLDSSAIGPVVVVDGSAKTFGELPFTMWVDLGANVNYSYMSIVSSSVSGKRFRLDHVTGPVSPINVTGPTTITGNYVTQYQITFDQSGVGSDFTSTVFTVEGTNYGVADSPKSFWWDKDSFHSFAYDSPLLVDAGKQYVWANTTGLSTLQSATLTVTTPGNITGNYETLYYLNVVSQYGNPYGTGWYLLTSEAKFGVTTPVDHGNRTIRVFTKWSGDVNIFTPEGTLIMTQPSTVIASWQTQYLVTFNTTLPNSVVLSIPRVPEIHPPGMEVFGMYYPAGDLIAAGPAPYIVAGTEGTRYVFAGWTLDAQAFTSDANVSLVVDGPHDVAVAYEIEHLLVINAIGVSDPFTATVMIATSTPTAHNLTPTSPIQEWLKHGVQATLTISTPNKIGHGEWAIFREWSGQAQGLNRTVSFAMSAPNTVNAVFFKVNPVAESIPYSILSGLICMFLSCLIIRKKRKGQGRKTSLPMTLGIMVSAAALIVAAVVSASIALGYGINVNELLDFTNWAVLFLATEAIILLLATAAVTTWINRRLYVQP
jgi:uncharacterized repeat protein (TIGR01451 family)